MPKASVIHVANPTTSVNLGVTRVPDDAPLVISEMRAVLRGSSSPSVTWRLNHHVNRDSVSPSFVVNSGTATTSTTTAQVIDVFDDANLEEDTWLWLTIINTMGTVEELFVIVYY